MIQSLQQAEDWFESRQVLRQRFVDRCGWRSAVFEPVGQDCAFRRYFRLRMDSKTAILMEAVPDDHERATPGHKLSDYIRIGSALKKRGLNTPAIYEAAENDGYLLLEDFGDVSFKQALNRDGDEKLLYGLAADILSELNQSAKAWDIALPDYYKSHVHKGRQRVIDWYVPAVHKAQNPDDCVKNYLAVWDIIEKTLPPCPQGFLHIDYHVENLMYLPERSGLQQCGILDFQGAMKGPLPYDLANLLEDVRIDVPADRRKEMLDYACRQMDAEQKEAFQAWYRILATQFHCRVIGQFIRLAVKDGKQRYLDYLPRVCGYLREGLNDPVLLPLSDWFTEQGIDFTVDRIDVSALSPFIRDDAF